MSRTSRRRLPGGAVVRVVHRLHLALAHLLIWGADAESVLGDIEEQAQDADSLGSSLNAARDTFSRAVYWWHPRARSARKAARRAAPTADLGPYRSRPQETLMSNALEDILSGLRILWRRRGFKSSVLLTLGLGIGATTTIFSVVDTVLLRPLPYQDADRLVALGTTFPGREWRDDAADLQHLAGVSVANFVDWRERARSFDHVEALEPRGVLLPDVGRGLEVGAAASVSPGLLDLLDARVHLGRSFLPEDFAADATPVRMLSYATWRDRYGADPSLIGRPAADGENDVLIGVFAPEFELPEAMGVEPQIWWPLDTSSSRYANRGMRSVFVLGRLAPGVEVAAARREMAALGVELAREFPDGNVLSDGRAFGIGVNGLKQETVGATGRLLAVFLAASGLLLLVAALNATHLLLARSLARRREFEVRQALGAGRGRLSLLLITESVALSLLGGLVGIALARIGVAAFVRLSPRSMPRLDEVTLDARILAACLLTAGAVGLVVGLLASWRLTGSARLSGLRTAAAEAGGSRLRHATTVAQLALAVVLLVGASLLMASFIHLVEFDPGFEPEGLWAFSTPLKGDGTEELWRKWDELTGAVGALGAVMPDGVAATSNLPFQDPNWAPGVLSADQSLADLEGGVAGYVITPSFPDVAGIQLLRGRGFERGDGPDSTAVVLVNEAFAMERFASLDVVGERLRLVGDDDSLDEVEVVGVLGNVVRGRAQEGLRPAIYLPYTQRDWPRAWVAMRFNADAWSTRQSGSPPSAVTDALREAVAAVSRIAPAADLAPMTARITRTHAEPRFRTALILGFALVATGLAVLGLYGSLSHLVSRRRREIGIRIALGARTRRVLALVSAEGARLTASGVALGLLGAWASTRVLQTYMFGVTTMSLGPVLFGLFGLFVVCLVATLVPARRAARTDPVENLRAE